MREALQPLRYTSFTPPLLRTRAACWTRNGQIFGEFIGNAGADEESYDIEIEPEQFRDALDRLVPNIFTVTAAELKALIDEFDTDGNGTISVLEFREFCYRIPHLAWKVWPTRMCAPCRRGDADRMARPPTLTPLGGAAALRT